MLLSSEISTLNVLAGFLWITVFAWMVSLGLTIYGRARRRFLPNDAAEDLKGNAAPLISVLLPARNEEDRVLVPCINSLLAQDYGHFEIICINDRSVDATGPILKSMAQTDGRLQVFDGAELPPGWLGKPFAMHQALGHARGEWLLATDADMIFDKTLIRTAFDYTRQQGADALSLMPHFETKSFWERVMIPTWAWVTLMFTVIYRVNDPKSRAAVGIGGFFLMRRCVLAQIGGYEALKDEVLEDVRLAEIIKSSGGKLLNAFAPDLLRTRMYRSLSEMWESCTKSWFAGMKFSLPLALLSVVVMYLIAVAPPIFAVASAVGMLLLNVDLWSLLIPAMASWLLQSLVLLSASWKSGVSPGHVFTTPLGLGLLYLMLFESSIRITIGKGVTWKGRRIYERGGVSPPSMDRFLASSD